MKSNYKNRVNNIFVLFVLTSLLQSCISSAYDEKLNAGYYLFATDVKSDMMIGFQDGDYGIGIIEETVFAVGQDEEFIIAKQHPKMSSGEVNKAITNYFIIPLKNKITQSPETNVYGPLSTEEFEQQRKKLSIEGLRFTILFKDLE